MPSNSESAFSEARVGSLLLKNRFIKSATYEGMTPDGFPGSELTEFHARIAKGGVALNTIAYGAVHPDGRTHEEQLLISEQTAPGLKQLADEVHSEGGKVSMQLTHCGYFTRNRHLSTNKPLSASANFNAYGLTSGVPFSRPMSKTEMSDIARHFGDAAEICMGSGFDAVEVHMGHGYLLSQFLTPGINRRKDKFGGSVRNRARFPEMVLQAVRQVTNGEVPILVKINMSDGFNGGVQPQDTVEYVRIFEDAGADAFILSGSYTSKTPFYLMRGDVPYQGMISVEKNLLQKAAIALFGPVIMKKYPFEENYFMPLARKIRSAVDATLVYQGGVVSNKGISQIMEEGFELIGLGRALIHDPDFLAKLRAEENFVSPCNHCNECMVEMDKGGVRCVLEQ